MWYSDIYTGADLRAKGRFKAEFFDERFGASISAAGEVKLVEIENVAALRREHISPTDFPEHVFNYVSLANIESHTGELVDFKPMKGKEILSTAQIFREGDLLYGRLRPYLNKCYHAVDPVKEGICTVECIVLVPDPTKILPSYLHAVLLSKFVLDQVEFIQTGASRPRVQSSDLLKLKIPLLSQDCQERIAELQRTMLQLRRQKRIEMSLLVEKTRETIARLVEGDEASDFDFVDLALPEEEKFDNPLPEAVSASHRQLDMFRNVSW